MIAIVIVLMVLDEVCVRKRFGEIVSGARLVR
jgi:hypothetical protein